jgi:predicted dehydrogenase
MNDPIGIGVLSFAHGHIHPYCVQIAAFPDARLVSCWDDDEARGREGAARHGMIYHANLDGVLGDPAVDAVIVTSETSKHPELVVAAAAAGKHILCQKPMALSLDDCDRMIEAVERAGIHFSMAFQMRNDPVNQKMKQLVDDGAVGRLSLVHRRHAINALFSKDFVEGKTHWHLEPDKNMGMFMDDATHAADWFYWMLGRPASVIAEIDNVVTDLGTDDTGVAVYRFSGGVFGVLTNSSVTRAAENTTEIYGDQGTIVQNYGDAPSSVLPRPHGVALKLYVHGHQPPEWQVLPFDAHRPHGERIAAVPRPFVDNLKAGAPPQVSARAGRVSVEMVLGAYQAAREGRRVTFPLS